MITVDENVGWLITDHEGSADIDVDGEVSVVVELTRDERERFR